MSFYSHSVSTPRTKRQMESDLNLVKMATICGYPGASTKCLPFIHSSFSPGPKPLTARSYTFMHKRGKTGIPMDKGHSDESGPDVVCYGKPEVLHLPDIPLLSDERRSPRRIGNSYIQKNKVCFRLKGINPSHVYSVNRIRPNVSTPHRNGAECLTVNSQKSSLFMGLNSSNSLNLALDSIAKATLQGTFSDQLEREVYLNGTVSPVSMALDLKLEQDCRHVIPALTPRKIRGGRRLGHVVSSRRLNDLIQNDTRFKTECQD